MLDGSDPFPKVTVPNLLSSAPGSSDSGKGSWLSDQLDSLASSPRTSRSMGRSDEPNPNQSADGRKKHPIPRSVLFADSESARQSADFRSRKAAGTSTRKKFDRTPLTQQEANAFMSLLNQALAGTSTPSSSSAGSASAGGDAHTPFGSYTSLISNPKTQSGSKALLQAFAKRNRLKRFEEAQAQRAKRFVREGLAAQIDPLLLEAGIDEAREQIAMCENLAELIHWAKRDVWGIGNPAPAVESGDLAEQLTSSDAAAVQENKKQDGPKYGKDTPYYASVLQLVFLAIRDRYRAPHVALSVVRVTRSLGIESYVLGVTGSLYNEVLKTQWDWLGDLQGVVSTLRQARETGILSAPMKHAASAPPAGATRVRTSFATTEDEAIRETVDRIANEVRKHVLDQQMSRDPAFKRSFLYGANDDVLGGEPSALQKKDTDSVATDWSQKWLVAQADTATSLAGQPMRLWQKQVRAEQEQSSRPSSGSGSGARGGQYGSSADRRPTRPYRNEGGYQARDTKGSSRYPSYSFRSPRSRHSDLL